MPEELAPDLIEELKGVALAAADGGAAIVRAQADEGREGFTTKSSPTDLVSEADRASERFITQYIRSQRPHDAIVGEEGTSVPGSSGISWAADPLDGTTNFYFRIPAYSVSVAAIWQGDPVAGAVVDCARGETWWAAQGQGAWRDGIRCAVASGRSELSTALVGTGFGYKRERRVFQAAVVADLIGDVRDIRRFGSAALDLCSVAGGRLDAYYEAGLNDWDWAAGRLICREAGGTAEMLPGGALLATTPELFGPLSSLLGRAFERAGALGLSL